MNTKRTKAWILAFFLTAAAVIYWPSLSGDFTNWDDRLLVADNPTIRSLSPSNLVHIFTSANQGAYLPVRLFSYALDHALWGQNPFGYHLSNIILHGLNAFLACLLFLELSGEARMALVAGLLFLVHPVQGESVAWISGRKEVLCGFFLLLSAVCFLRWAGRGAASSDSSQQRFGAAYTMSLAFFVLACLSKASAIVLPGLLVIMLLLRRVRAGRAVLAKGLGPFFVLGLLFFALNVWVGASHGAVKKYHGGSAATTFMTIPCVLADYVKSFFFPHALSAKYLVPLAPSVRSGQFVGAAILLAAIFALITFLRSRMATAGAFWFIFALLPFLNIIPISTLRADRYTYVASLGVCLAASPLASRRWPAATGRLVLLSFVVALFALLSWQRAHVWANSCSLWRDTVAKSPLSPTAQANLGEAYLHRGQRAMAEAQFVRALACDPGFAPALTNLAYLWREAGRRDDAFRAAQRAVKADPHNADAWINLGILQAEKGDLEIAYLSLGEAAHLNPNLAEAYFNMAGVRLIQKRFDDALRLYRKAISVQPTYAEAHLRMGILYAQAGRPEQAVAAFQEVCRLRPDNAEAFYNLALVYMIQSRRHLAEEAAAQALRLGLSQAQELLDRIRRERSEKQSANEK